LKCLHWLLNALVLLLVLCRAAWSQLDLRTDLSQSSTPLLAQLGQTLDELRGCDLWFLSTYQRHGRRPVASSRLAAARAQLVRVAQDVEALPIGDAAKRDVLETLNQCQAAVQRAESSLGRADALRQAVEMLIAAEERLRPFQEGQLREPCRRILEVLSGGGESLRAAVNDVRGNLDFEDLGPRERRELLERLARVEDLLAKVNAQRTSLEVMHGRELLTEDGTRAFLAALHVKLAASRSALIARARASGLLQGLTRQLGNALTFRAFEAPQHAELRAAIAKLDSWQRRMRAEIAAAGPQRQLLVQSQDALRRHEAAASDSERQAVIAAYAPKCPPGFFDHARSRAFVTVLDDPRVARFVRVNIEEMESSLSQLERRLAGK